MIIISFHALQPLGQIGMKHHRIIAFNAPVGILATNQIAEAVGVVKEARLKHLLMQSCAV